VNSKNSFEANLSRNPRPFIKSTKSLFLNCIFPSSLRPACFLVRERHVAIVVEGIAALWNVLENSCKLLNAVDFAYATVLRACAVLFKLGAFLQQTLSLAADVHQFSPLTERTRYLSCQIPRNLFSLPHTTSHCSRTIDLELDRLVQDNQTSTCPTRRASTTSNRASTPGR